MAEATSIYAFIPGVPKNVLTQDITAVHYQYLGAHYGNWQVSQDIENKGFMLIALAYEPGGRRFESFRARHLMQ